MIDKSLNLQEKIEYVIDNYSIELFAGLTEIFGYNVATVLEVIDRELWFNYYEDIRYQPLSNWESLAQFLLEDDCLDFNDSEIEDLETLKGLKLEQYLTKMGYRIASNGFAVGLTDESLKLLK